jgi:hypothetical protein
MAAMPITLRFGKREPVASAEFLITDGLSVYGVQKIESSARRELDSVLVSAEFETVLGDVRAFLESQLDGGQLDVVELRGVACHDVNVYRLGIRLVVREKGAESGMSETGREQFAALAGRIRENLHLP